MQETRQQNNIEGCAGCLTVVKGLELFEVPRQVVFGPGAIGRVGDVLTALGLRRGLIITGHIHSRHIATKVSEQCIDCQIMSDDELDLVDVVKGMAAFTDVDFIAGVGGGRVIDLSKVIAHRLNKHLISIPTVASHDGIASPYVSFLMQDDLNKMGLGKVKKTPLAIIVDTSVVAEAPRVFLMSGIGELLGKRVALMDWKLAHRIRGEDYSESAAMLALSSHMIIMNNINKLNRHGEEGARVVVKALLGCGVAMAIAGSTRPCSGSEHLFSHSLDLIARRHGIKQAMHGMQVALSSVVMLYLYGANWRRVIKIMRKLGLPTSFRELGYDRELVIEALMNAHKIRPDRYTILGSDGLTREAAEAALEQTGVIA
ncbi:MAG: glycerol-1-phosphate dehydrogenase [Caldivirga sp. JCHS_4]|jgi:Glycerol dehydrogenase and related enzymes|nr:MAG: glycerol-1-phosphate dehydrogenase [Caldivirga sp. JCHS_4]